MNGEREEKDRMKQLKICDNRAVCLEGLISAEMVSSKANNVEIILCYSNFPRTILRGTASDGIRIYSAINRALERGEGHERD